MGMPQPGAGEGGMGGGMPSSAGQGGMPGMPQPGQIQVTPEEKESIDRLAGLGFSKAQVAQAFFACDKNEEYAANFLFESMQDDQEFMTNAAIQQSMAQQPAQPQPAASQQQPEQPKPEQDAPKEDAPMEEAPKEEEKPAASDDQPAQPDNNKNNNNDEEDGSAFD